MKKFAEYSAAGFDLVPLHRPDAVSPVMRKGKPVKRDGKVVKRRDGKRPLHNNWTSRDYEPEAVIAEAIRTGRNVGVRLRDDQLVVDVDPRNGGTEGFAKLCADFSLEPDGWPLVVTGSGGSHYYLTKPPGLAVLDTLEGYPGVEFKSMGRQIVAAGSIHPDTGKPYDWDALSLGPDAAPVVPAALLEAIQRPERSGEATEGGQYSQEQLAAALDRLDPADFREHDKWLRLMLACHHATNGDGRSEFIEWSVTDPQYADDAEVIGRRWDSLHADRDDAITYRTLNLILSQHGAADAQAAPDASADFDLEPIEDAAGELTRIEDRGLKLNKFGLAQDTFENALCAVHRADLLPSWDELKQNVVFRAEALPWEESYGRVLTDHVARMIRVYLMNEHQGVGFSPSREHLHEALMTVAYGRKFNPVIEYLDSLTWDGVERLPFLFGRYFNCGIDPYTKAVSLCFGIGAVRRMRSPGSKFDTMPILRSPQGWNKSSAVRVLFGENWYSDADLGSLRDKDSAMKLRGVWVQEFAEIESLTRAETGTLKAFCSRATDRQRDPYGRVVEDVPRRLVFCGTVNEGGYLKDATGGRRFWPLTVRERIDLERLATDRDQLWAEAAAREARGESDVLPPELWPVAAERQAEQTSTDPWVDLLRSFVQQRAADWRRWHERAEHDADDFKPPFPGHVHTTELFEALSISPGDQTKDKAQRLRVVMEAALGWPHNRNVRVGGRIGAGYVRPKPTSTSSTSSTH